MRKILSLLLAVLMLAACGCAAPAVENDADVINSDDLVSVAAANKEVRTSASEYAFVRSGTYADQTWREMNAKAGVDTNNAEITTQFQCVACSELSGSWSEQKTYLVRGKDGKLAWREAVWTLPSASASGTLEVAVKTETVTNTDLGGLATFVPTQGFSKFVGNSRTVVGLLAFSGSIVQAVSIKSPTAKPAIDTMTEQGVNANNGNAHWISRQPDTGYIIPQSGSMSTKKNLSVILARPSE
jgi:hypothetical protein